MPDSLLTLIDPASEPGEELAVLERVVVAPSRGVFTPLATDGGPGDGAVPGPGALLVLEGQAIGEVENSGVTTPVCSPFTGVLMGMLASAGERVREGEPVAWLRVTAA